MTHQYMEIKIKELEKRINALEQEPCEDAISREAVLDKAWDVLYEGKYIQVVDVGDIQDLPSVTPNPKIGRWIKKDDWDGDVCYDCSICGDSWTTIDGEPWNDGMNYCPNCGARMVENEVKE